MAVDEGSDHTMSVWDWSRGERGTKVRRKKRRAVISHIFFSFLKNNVFVLQVTETKCSTETVVAAEFHPLEAGVIVAIGKGHANFWQLDSTSLTLSRKTGLFDQRDKPKYVTCLAFSFTGDVLTGDSNGNIFVWGRGYNAVTKALRKVNCSIKSHALSHIKMIFLKLFFNPGARRPDLQHLRAEGRLYRDRRREGPTPGAVRRPLQADRDGG